MNKLNVLIFSLLIILAGMQVGGFASAEQTHTYTQFGANSGASGNQSFQQFLNRILWVIYAIIGVFMVAPWLFYMYNSIKAQHEEDPQAEMKKKKWFSLAVELDIIGAIVLSGVIFAWFKWLATG